MTPERWQKIGELFDTALRLAPERRASFLEEACTGDAELRREVESLIAHEGAEDFPCEPALSEVAHILNGIRAGSLEGRKLGAYKIQSLLGAGGMGEVYLAEDTRLGRRVALKLLPVSLSLGGDRLRRFEQEARAASALNHPNILTIYELGQEESLHFIAAEFIEGETLRERLARGTVRIDEALDVAAQVASALAAAHRVGVVHRDIKPENIMVRDDGLVKVLDFGLAKLLSQGRGDTGTWGRGEDKTSIAISHQTQPGLVMGTVAYMSPEQARGNKVDARSDIWSLGVVLYEMLTEKTPFAGETMSDSIAAILTAEPAPLDENVPAELRRIINKTLCKQADERYQTVKDLQIDLNNLKKEIEYGKFVVQSSEDNLETQKTRILENVSTAASFPPEGGTTNVPSTEYIFTEVKKHEFGFVVSALILFVLIGVGYFFYPSSPSAVNSIAVLPFQNKNNDAELDYLSEGLAESVIDRLSSLSQLKVIARNSSFRYKDENPDLQKIAEEIGVQAVVTGKFTRRGDDLSIRVELIDARDNSTIWSSTFNYKAADALKVEEDIARAVSQYLQISLTNPQKEQLAKHETTNPAAYELMLKGRFYARKGGAENRRKAIEFLNQAIIADPNYALAYAVLAARYNSLLTNNAAPPGELLPKAEAAARKALELDDQLAEAHYAMALVKSSSFDWEASEREFLQAIESNPNLARAHGGFAQYLSLRGRHEQALAEINLAKNLDPLSPVIRANVGRLLCFARRWDEAIDSLKELTQLEPNFPTAYINLADVYAAKGMYQEAAESYRKGIELGEDGSSQKISLAVVFAKSGKKDEAQAILKELQTGENYVSLTVLSRLHAALGEKDNALEMLEKAFHERDTQLQYVGAEPLFDELRSDARFQELVRKLGL